MRAVLRRIVDVFSSFGLSCVLLLLLGLLTWLGTLEQVDTGLYDVQKKYFESFVLVHRVGSFAIPLPGANLVLCLLFVNLIVGGVVRLRRHRSAVGILITHLGIAFLLLSGFVKAYYSDDGHVTLYEGQRASHFQSYYRWELAILEPLGNGRLREHIVPQELFADAIGAAPVTLSAPGLPFDLEVSHFATNCRPMPKGPMFDVSVPVIDGVFLQAQAPSKEAEANIAGSYVSAVQRDGRRATGLVWGAQDAPFTVNVAGKDWAIDLRKERYPMPFTLVLDEFTKEDHPRSDMPKSFASDVTVIEGSTERALRISMNEPLRSEGLVLYQASWGPSTARPGDPLFSTFAVVRNPADQFPLYACIVIATGLLLHFTRKLVGHIRVEAARS